MGEEEDVTTIDDIEEKLEKKEEEMDLDELLRMERKREKDKSMEAPGHVSVTMYMY